MFSILGESEKITKNTSFIDDMNFNFFIPAKNISLIEKFITTNKETIKTRQEIFSEIINDYDMRVFFEKFSSNLELMNEYRQKSRYFPETSSNESLYYSFREFLIFTETIELIAQNLSKTQNQSLKELYIRALSVKNSIWYNNAKIYIEKIDSKLRNIKSVLIGVNLDAGLSPYEAGIVSLSDKPFVGNSLFDKLFAARADEEKYICIAPLKISESAPVKGLNMSIYGAINDIVSGSLKKMKKILETEFINSAGFLFDILDEIRFIAVCIKFISLVQKNGMNLCIPDISDEHEINGLYNLELLCREKSNVVSNDVFFDASGKIHILSGANSGGKSIYLRSVGTAQVLFQLGMPVPAKSARMKIYDSIFSCFRNKVKDVTGGSFENECKLIAEILKKTGENSLILFDEVFSTTNSYDAYLIATKALEYIARSGCSMIYVTHIHELINNADRINSLSGIKSKVDFLSADSRKNYKIIRCKGNYCSAAKDILKNCGLDFLYIA